MEARDLNDALDESTGKRLGPAITPRQERWIVAAVLAAFVALATGFSLGPIFEGRDEIEHYRFMYVLGETWHLPDRTTSFEEFHQPPLYYILGALMRLPFDDSGFEEIAVTQRNQVGLVPEIYNASNWRAIPSNNNRNYFIHSRTESFPYLSGTARAIHAIRLFSVVLGAGTLLACYGIFAILWTQRPERRLVALAIVAFWPSFIYLSSCITNDNPLIFLSTLSLLLALVQLRDGPSAGRAIALGFVLGAALLTKISALMLAAPIGMTILLGGRRMWRYGLITLGVALALGGWWYVQGAILYNDPTGLRMQYQVIPGASIPPGEWKLSHLLVDLSALYQRLWARFGRNYYVVVSPVIYILFDLLTIMGIIGAVLTIVLWVHNHQYLSARSHPSLVVVVSWGVTVLVALVIFTMTTHLASPRYLMPGVVVWSSLLASGLDFWIPCRIRTSVTLGGMVFMSTIAAICLLKYFLPAYQPLPLPVHIEYPLAIRYENAAELIGVAETTIYVRPGEIATITLYWRAIQPTEHELFTLVFSKDNNPLFQMSMPATGNLRSTEWQPGQTWAESWLVHVPPDTPPRIVIPIGVALRDMTEERHLVPADANGQAIYPVIVRMVVDTP